MEIFKLLNKMLKVKDNKNYAAKIVRLQGLRKHPNADKLQIVNIDFQPVITGLDAKDGDLYVYFPLECSLNPQFLSFSNAYSDKELNADKEKKGFFNAKGRVKAIRLRGSLSEGYIHPLGAVNNWLLTVNPQYQLSVNDLGTEFDHIGDIKFVQKYVVPTKYCPARKNKQKAAKRESKLVENQFRLHVDTENLKRNMFKISPDDTISISYKLHGTSGVFSRVICKKPLNVIQKFARFIGIPVQETQYDSVFSSRKVIKNSYADKEHNSFYSHDIWGDVAKELEGKILDGITLYCEIVGQMPNGKWIQKQFDYGAGNNQHLTFVYRITYTNPQGNVFEFTTDQIHRYCEKYGLATPKLFYHGPAKYLYPEINVGEHWHENVLNRLVADYNDKNCFMCQNTVPEEGIVLRRENTDDFDAYKLKSPKFLEHETKQLDSGEENIEDQTEDEEVSVEDVEQV